MRKTIAKTFCALTLCSLLVLITAGTTMAYDSTYTRTDHPTQVEPVIDGVWTPENEWLDGEPTWIGEDVVFASTYSMVSMEPITVTTNFVIEFLTDDTNDAGDYFQMCIDGYSEGGTAPQTGDFKIEVVGHGNVEVYEGDGSGWVAVTPDSGAIIFAESISDSPNSATPHWIIEITILKTGSVPSMDAYWAFRLAVYDDSNSGAGEQAWPPTSEADVPDGYGYQSYDQDNYVNPIPEGLTFGVMAVLTSISMIVGYKYFVKRKETEA